MGLYAGIREGEYMASIVGYWVLSVPEFSKGESGDSRLTWHYPFTIIDWGHITDRQLHGQWDEPASDPFTNTGRIQQFIKGLRVAVEYDTPVEFS